MNLKTSPLRNDFIDYNICTSVRDPMRLGTYELQQQISHQHSSSSTTARRMRSAAR